MKKDVIEKSKFQELKSLPKKEKVITNKSNYKMNMTNRRMNTNLIIIKEVKKMKLEQLPNNCIQVDKKTIKSNNICDRKL